MKNENVKLKMKKYLGVDWGEARIGLALGDDETKIASPLKVVKTIGEVIDEAKRSEAEILVIGLPQFDFYKNKVNVFNREFMAKYDNFICLLKRDLKLPIRFVNEILTTKAAARLPGNKKTKAAEDAVAAMIILQNYFDSI